MYNRLSRLARGRTNFLPIFGARWHGGSGSCKEVERLRRDPRFAELSTDDNALFANIVGDTG
eukprot:gene4684-15009_t